MINHVTSEKTKISITAKQLAFCGVAIGLAFVLSHIKFAKLPFGGSVTLFSMLVACLPGYWFGPIVGIISGVAYGLLNLIDDTYIIYFIQFIVDYILAFGALGLAGLFSNSKYGLYKGYAVGILGRYFFAVLSGVIFFADYAAEANMSPLPYSLIYNATYIFWEALITYVVLFLPPVRKLMNYVKTLANS